MLGNPVAAICHPAGDSPKAAQATGCTLTGTLHEVSPFISYRPLAVSTFCRY